MGKDNKVRYTFSLVTQGKKKFYSLTMPSEVLAECCFVTTRDEDPVAGFQRVLDADRAQAIADYIDAGLGTVPGSIVLSAQPDAELAVVGQGRSIEFKRTPHSFLVLDGQHRVYGFNLAKTRLRVPVVIYSGLTRQEEARLFMDINTKQRPVPNPLLLDIKALAEAEEGDEPLLREIFDLFHESADSALNGLTSPSAAQRGRINRVTFYAAARNATSVFREPEAKKIYQNLNAFLFAFRSGLARVSLTEKELINPIVFKGVMAFYPKVARRVQAQFGTEHSADNYADILSPMWDSIKTTKIKRPGQSYKEIAGMLEVALDSGIQI